MDRLLWIGFVLLLTVWPAAAQEARPGAAGLGDSYDAALGNGGYDAQHYTLALDVDFNRKLLGLHDAMP